VDLFLRAHSHWAQTRLLATTCSAFSLPLPHGGMGKTAVLGSSAQ
jgi:hypothetical protein